jgi:hypothetical protein
VIARSVLILISIAALVACGRGQATIPPGAHVVHVRVDGLDVRLDPARVPAGDVYVVLETPNSSVGFAQGQPGPDVGPGPLSDEDLARLSRGSTEGLAISGFDNSGCSEEQRAEDWGMLGYCGNVSKVVLGAGRVAFFTGSVDGDSPRDESRSIAVLEVLP